MGLLDKLTGGGVDWSLQVEGGRTAFRPGETVRATVTYTPTRDIDARAVVASLIATEHYEYTETRRDSRGDLDTDRRTESDEVGRQETQLSGPGRFASGASRTHTFELVIPPGAPPTFQSDILRLTWQVEVKFDVGGRDPSVEQELVVLQPPELVHAAGASMGGFALAPRAEGSQDGKAYAIALDPAPLSLGAPFQGAFEFPEDPGADTRVELKVRVETIVGGNVDVSFHSTGSMMITGGRRDVDEMITIWSGGLSEAGTSDRGRRYTFGGTLPAQAVPTVQLPHGRSKAVLEVIVPKRFRPDTRYSREVALATG